MLSMNYSLSVDHSDSKVIIYVHKYATNSSEYSCVYLYVISDGGPELSNVIKSNKSL